MVASEGGRTEGPKGCSSSRRVGVDEGTKVVNPSPKTPLHSVVIEEMEEDEEGELLDEEEEDEDEEEDEEEERKKRHY